METVKSKKKLSVFSQHDPFDLKAVPLSKAANAGETLPSNLDPAHFGKNTNWSCYNHRYCDHWNGPCVHVLDMGEVDRASICCHRRRQAQEGCAKVSTLVLLRCPKRSVS